MSSKNETGIKDYAFNDKYLKYFFYPILLYACQQSLYSVYLNSDSQPSKKIICCNENTKIIKKF